MNWAHSMTTAYTVSKQDKVPVYVRVSVYFILQVAWNRHIQLDELCVVCVYLAVIE